FYAALGSEVTVVEMTSGLLPGVDRDLVDVLQRRLKGRFKEMLFGTLVESLEEVPEGISAKLSGAAVDEARVYDRVLVAVGRRPNSEGLGLEQTAARVDDRGFIEVDAQRRTAEPSLY